MRTGEAGVDHFRFYFADIGPTKAYGFAINTKLRKNPFDYQVAALKTEKEAFDVYLVDGRYRVACVMVCFLHALRRGGDMKVVRVGLHDTNQGWRNYDIVKEIAVAEFESKRLTVLALKEDVTEKDLYSLWLKHMTNDQRR